MMNIGEFAALTGLGVKALRHYDERGVLTPAAVDPVSGYRKYGEEQVRTGVVLKTLRDAGVPVAEAAVAATSAATGAASAPPHISSPAGERSPAGEEMCGVADAAPVAALVAKTAASAPGTPASRRDRKSVVEGNTVSIMV